MKYRLLSKEQFETLHREFATFLAVQEITKKDWEKIKTSQPEKVQQQLEQFSDLVWKKILSKTLYLEHYSTRSINLFYCKPESIDRIVVQVTNTKINLLEKEGFDWFLDHSHDPSIQYFKGEKPYTSSRSEELFKLIEQGAILADKKLYEAVNQLIKPLIS